jgi:hypothetical protein
VDFAHRQRDGEGRAIAPLGTDAPPAADGVRLAGLAIPCQVRIMLFLIGGRHKQTKVLPDHVVGTIPKEALGRRD